jgi:hypothetical protein
MLALMKQTADPPDALKRAWRRWTEIVTLFALRHPARLTISPHEFREVREELIRLIETLAAAGDDPRREAYYRELDGLVRPFLSPRTLARTDYEVLLDLLARCRKIERELMPGRLRLEGLARTLLPLVLGTLVFGLALAVVTLAGGVESAPIAWLRGVARVTWVTLRRMGDFQKTLIVGVAAILAAMVLVARSGRTR